MPPELPETMISVPGRKPSVSQSPALRVMVASLPLVAAAKARVGLPVMKAGPVLASEPSAIVLVDVLTVKSAVGSS